MTLETEHIAENARPGQFIMLYCNDGRKILPRPISICGADPDTGHLRLVYRVTGKGTGTEEFSRTPEGTVLRAEGPLGNGFDTDRSEKENIMIVGGGVGIPPMLFTAGSLRSGKTIVLGFRSGTFLADEFEKYGRVYISTEDGSAGTKGNVLDVIKTLEDRPDRIYACGPAPMLRALSSWAEENGIPCYISLEERMACGIGACLACVCRSAGTDPHTNVKNKRVCSDGPVFLSTEVLL
ncbi:MAG: dihydroorotate dehydrogenase electron transfer subunit [Blautia sp.]|nr:dihydroorotate dehydrogenase electron transfer subunit [Blautia sp.]